MKINMSHKVRFSLVVSLILFSSCRDLDDNTVIVDPQAMEVSGMDYIVSLSQKLEGPNTFQVFIQNSEAVECIDSVIPTWSSDTEGSILELSTTALPDCDHDLSFINQELDISDLEEGFQFRVKVEDIENEVAVEMTDASFGMKFRTTDRLTIEHTSILRIPENIAWGFTNLTADESRDVEQDFNRLEGITQDQATAAQLDEGYYGHFTIGDLASVTGINQVTDSGQSMILWLNGDDSWNTLETMLTGLRDTHPNLQYFFQNAEGEILEAL